MTSVSIQEWQVLSCLEVEPELLDPAEPWVVNDAVYRVTQGDLTLSFSIAPSYRDVRIILRRGEEHLYELNASDVSDVVYRRESDLEQIEVILTDRDRICLRIKPQICLEQSVLGRSI